MMKTRECKEKQTGTQRLGVSKRFGMYKDEEKKEARIPGLVEDQTLKQLKEAWMKARWQPYDSDGYGDDNYQACLEEIKGIHYSAKDVENFSIALVEFQDGKDFTRMAGYFLSALINNCPDSDFVIHTRHLGRIGDLGLLNTKNTGRIDNLGLFNTKNIMIDGDAGYYLGDRMSGGSITVEGDAGYMTGPGMKKGEIVIDGDCGDHLGDKMQGGKITVKGNARDGAGLWMRNGEIVINGDAGNRLGWNMKGGKIVVKKNCGKQLGYQMTAGELHLEGEYESLGWDMKGGKIYHKGRLIVNK